MSETAQKEVNPSFAAVVAAADERNRELPDFVKNARHFDDKPNIDLVRDPLSHLKYQRNVLSLMLSKKVLHKEDLGPIELSAVWRKRRGERLGVAFLIRQGEAEERLGDIAQIMVEQYGDSCSALLRLPRKMRKEIVEGSGRFRVYDKFRVHFGDLDHAIAYYKGLGWSIKPPPVGVQLKLVGGGA